MCPCMALACMLCIHVHMHCKWGSTLYHTSLVYMTFCNSFFINACFTNFRYRFLQCDSGLKFCNLLIMLFAYWHCLNYIFRLIWVSYSFSVTYSLDIFAIAKRDHNTHNAQLVQTSIMHVYTNHTNSTLSISTTIWYTSCIQWTHHI